MNRDALAERRVGPPETRRAVRLLRRIVLAGSSMSVIAACGSGDDSTMSGASDASKNAETSMSDASADSFAPSAGEMATNPLADATVAIAVPDASDASVDVDTDSNDGSSAQDGADSALIPPVVVSLVRFANWSPDSPAVDACVAPHGTGAFMGPIVAPLELADSSATGMSFPTVSAYVDLSPGQYDVRFVVAGAMDCQTGIGPDGTTPTLIVGSVMTMALLGDSNPMGGDQDLQIAAFSDDIDTSQVALRFINASPSVPSADFGTGALGSSNFAPLFVNVPFGTASNAQDAVDAAEPVDLLGYVSSGALASVTLSAHTHGAQVDSVVAMGFSAASGSVVTVALVGVTSSGIPTRLVECVDNAGSANGLSNCNW
jgi:uncharacterized protein DUF4397